MRFGILGFWRMGGLVGRSTEWFLLLQTFYDQLGCPVVLRSVGRFNAGYYLRFRHGVRCGGRVGYGGEEEKEKRKGG